MPAAGRQPAPPTTRLPTIDALATVPGLYTRSERTRSRRPGRSGRWLLLAAACAVAGLAVAIERSWKPLAEDDLHDPASPAVDLLQEPAAALSTLPPDPMGAGNQVNWIQALRDGYINPRTNVFPETKVNVLDLDVIMPDTGEMRVVVFPHRPHTEWLDCANCHEWLFKSKAGETPVNMFKILQGEYCGRCHGAVAFPLTECYRCHSLKRSDM